MDTLIKADIFFFISSVAIIVVTILASIILFYFIKFSRTLCRLLEDLQENLKDSEEFIAELKERLENNLLFRFLFPLSRKRNRSKNKNANKNKEKVE